MYILCIFLNNSLSDLKTPNITLLATVSGNGTITLNDSLSNYRYLYANFGTDTERYGTHTYLPIDFIKTLNSVFINVVESGGYYAMIRLNNITDTNIVIGRWTVGNNEWSSGKFYLYGIK